MKRNSKFQFHKVYQKYSILLNALIFLVFSSPCYFVNAQDVVNDDDLRVYNSVDLFFIDNSKASGGSGINDQQIQALDSILTNLSENFKAGDRNVLLFVCNGRSSTPAILTNYRSHDLWVRDIREDNSYLGPQFQFDNNKLRKFLSNDPFLARSINVYYYFPFDYLTSQFVQNNAELSRYLNVLPRQLATLLSDMHEIVNVHIYLPYTTGQIDRELIEQRIKSLGKFKSNDASFIRTNIVTHVN